MHLNSNHTDRIDGYFNKIGKLMPDLEICLTTFQHLASVDNANSFVNLIHIFTPYDTNRYEIEPYLGSTDDKINIQNFYLYINQFEKEDNFVLTEFCKFLIYLVENAKKLPEINKFKLLNLFKTASLYL